MKKETLLTLSVVLLLLLNLGTLGYLFVKSNRPHPMPPPHGAMRLGQVGPMIVQELNFTQAQQDSFDLLKREHRSSIKALDATNNDLLVAYLELLNAPVIDVAVKDSLEIQMGEIQRKKAQATLQHFEAVKALCNEEQKKGFNLLIPKLINVIAAPQGPPPPPMGGHGPR